MIITDKVENEAILSSNMQVGEFRIKNSSKAFAILSSGLYANKIRAIIRELSCNAVDAHIAAGKPTEPIECHLPSALEPWFAIRDTGIGLSNDDVVNIYTTYFESTKTSSNDYIGALGLGSKSPFSYTENFSVTSVKDGKKGIYSAFINNQGLPSIVLLQSEDTTEPNGVEVKFAVDQDFDKFRQEAAYVYSWFKVKPRLTGAAVNIPTIDYAQKDFAPGIHLKSRSSVTYNRQQSCMALMGNISYPIMVPNKEQFGYLASYLDYEFHIEFDIGELDIQASREGLSYIKDTIDAIKAKLEIIHASIDKNIDEQLKGVTGIWETAAKYRELDLIDVYRTSINKRLAALTHPQAINNGRAGNRFNDISLTPSVLTEYNVAITAFTSNWSKSRASKVKLERSIYNNATRSYDTNLIIGFKEDSVFIKNDLKVGAAARAKHNLNWTQKKVYYIISVADKTKPNMIDEFVKKVLYNPPKDQIILASSLKALPKKVREKKTKIVKMVKSGRLSGRLNNTEWVWRNVDESTISDWKDIVYVKINGLVVYKDRVVFPIHDHYSKIMQLANFTLVGVDEEGAKVLAARGCKEYFAHTDELTQNFFKSDRYELACYYNAIHSVVDYELGNFASVLSCVNFNDIDNKTGKLYTIGKKLADAVNQNGADACRITRLLADHATEKKFSIDTKMISTECETLLKSYQMLSLLDYCKLRAGRRGAETAGKFVVSYINQIGV